MNDKSWNWLNVGALVFSFAAVVLSLVGLRGYELAKLDIESRLSEYNSRLNVLTSEAVPDLQKSSKQHADGLRQIVDFLNSQVKGPQKGRR